MVAIYLDGVVARGARYRRVTTRKVAVCLGSLGAGLTAWDLPRGGVEPTSFVGLCYTVYGRYLSYLPCVAAWEFKTLAVGGESSHCTATHCLHYDSPSGLCPWCKPMLNMLIGWLGFRAESPFSLAAGPIGGKLQLAISYLISIPSEIFEYR